MRADARALDAAPVELTALEHVALMRELAVDGDGTAGELELSLAVQHAAAGELLVTLTAPSGAAAAVPRAAQRRRVRRDVSVSGRRKDRRSRSSPTRACAACGG